MRLLPAPKPIPVANPWKTLRISYAPFSFPKASGSGSGRPGLAFTKNLHLFAVKALQCCSGVKEKARGRKTAGCLLQGLRSPGPPNRD